MEVSKVFKTDDTNVTAAGIWESLSKEKQKELEQWVRGKDFPLQRALDTGKENPRLLLRFR